MKKLSCFAALSLMMLLNGCPPNIVPCPPCPCMDENNSYLTIINRGSELDVIVKVTLLGPLQNQHSDNLLTRPLEVGQQISIPIPTQGVIGDWEMKLEGGRFTTSNDDENINLCEAFSEIDLGFLLPTKYCVKTFRRSLGGEIVEDVPAGLEFTYYWPN